jgi:hypothetical protein
MKYYKHKLYNTLYRVHPDNSTDRLIENEWCNVNSHIMDAILKSDFIQLSKDESIKLHLKNL